MQPQPAVHRKGKSRRGKGFSRAELSEAGVSFREALKSGIPVDRRRRTKCESNIKILRRHLQFLGSRKKKQSKSVGKKKI